MNVRPSSPDIGDQPVFFADVTDSAVPSLPADPTAGRLLVMNPSGAVEEFPFASMTVGPTGHVEVLYPSVLGQSGLWRCRWEFTAGVVAAEEFQFRVRKRFVPNPA